MMRHTCGVAVPVAMPDYRRVESFRCIQQGCTQVLPIQLSSSSNDALALEEVPYNEAPQCPTCSVAMTLRAGEIYNYDTGDCLFSWHGNPRWAQDASLQDQLAAQRKRRRFTTEP